MRILPLRRISHLWTKAPHDIAWFPRRGADKIAKVVYGRPQKKGRVIFGELEKFGKIWRAGANEATEITFFKDAKFGEQTLKAGTYSLFVIPEQNHWVLIFNSALNQWGAYSYNKENDVLRYNVKVEKTRTPIEAFSIYFEKTDKGANMVMGWDDTIVRAPIGF